jgi:hypothetical protein
VLSLTCCLCCQVILSYDLTQQTTIATGLIQNYGLCLDKYARHLFYIEGGNGGKISCYAYGSTPCNTPK